MPRLSGLRVLVVDDDADSAQALATLMTLDGAEARIEHAASRIADVVRDFNPALILLDLELAGLDGYEACRLVRRMRGVDIYIAAVTGWSGDEVRLRCEQAGFDAHVTKPIGLAWLEDTCALAMARQDRQNRGQLG